MRPETAQWLYGALAPCIVLSLLLMGRNPRLARARVAGSILLSSAILLLPLGSWPVCRWIAVLEPSPSITLTLLLVILLILRVGGWRLFAAKDWIAACLFGSIASLILYPMGLGLTAHDSYEWGWEPILPLATAAVATILLLQGNRFGVILLLGLGVFAMGAMESGNLWDVLLDPVVGAASLAASVVLIFRKIRHERRQGTAESIARRP